MESLTVTPGTVSKILWHFTGGPAWNQAENRQNTSPKPAAQAYAKLRSIITSHELQVGNYKELFRVNVPRRKLNKVKRTFENAGLETKELTSSPVCCLADVPIMHLGYLGRRYGKFAIGFHREAVVEHGFNPVFYGLDDARAMQDFHNGFRHLDAIDSAMLRLIAENWKQSVDDFAKSAGLVVADNVGWSDVLFEAANDLDRTVERVRNSLNRVLGLVKTFSTEEFGSIYCEREWRSLTTFGFADEDIAMVVLPRRVDRTEYFKHFITRSPIVSREIPVIPWEDLVEH